MEDCNNVLKETCICVSTKLNQTLILGDTLTLIIESNVTISPSLELMPLTKL